MSCIQQKQASTAKNCARVVFGHHFNVAQKISYKQKGVTLVELMVSLVLASLIIIAASVLFLGSQNTARTQDDASQIQDSGRFAVNLISRVIRQSAYSDWGAGDASAFPSTISANAVSNSANCPLLLSASNPAPTQNLQGCDGAPATGMYGDELVVNFFGSGSINDTHGGLKGDGTVKSCLGADVLQASSVSDIASNRFYVALGAKSNELELYCDTITLNGPGLKVVSPIAQPLVIGVETLQFIYGIDRDADGYADVYLPAQNMLANDWKNVKAIRFAMIIRAQKDTRVDTDPHTFTNNNPYHLFGADYSAANPGDQGAQFYPAADKLRRIRKLFSATVQIRNPVDGW